MAQDSRQEQYECLHAKAYKNLSKAREEEARKSNYNAHKTMPFMMPLLFDKNKKVIIVSPLKVLQEDQVR